MVKRFKTDVNIERFFISVEKDLDPTVSKNLLPGEDNPLII